ncbi:MAG: 16S rRNA (guanine(527)-N(7))-methyltransferase RsmG [Eubacterium sp.]|nr:16S rRNA (guanine(527)-N(7))-methyltransferase RsmG [Eubacterium sp.]
MINKELLKEYSEDFGVNLNGRALDNFDNYADLLVKTNKVMNLTAITEPEQILIKHFVDSLEVLKYDDIHEGASVIDVGTGAGFPGVPLLIARNDLKLTLLDSLSKRLDFLEEVLDTCNLSANLVHSRAEDGGQDMNLRETFDFATARAVAPLNVLCEYCLPFVKVGGHFVALKGSGEETEEAEGAISKLGGEIISKVSYKLPNGDPRSIIIIKKISQTSTQYPRKPKKIAASPLK